MKLTRLFLAATLALPAALPAATVLSSGHFDIGIGWEGDPSLDLHIHDELNAVEYAPDEALFDVHNGHLDTVPNVPSYTAMFGLAAGTQIWTLPNSSQPGLLYLGFGTEELNSLDFPDPITLTLTGASTPVGGNFWAWLDDGFGDAVNYMSTSDGLSPLDLITLAAGGHDHYNLSFSAPGTYELEFTASAYNATLDQVITDTATYTFVVPEPASGAALLLTAGALLRRRRRS